MLGGQRKELDGKGDRLPIPLSLTRISRRYYKALFEKNDAVHDDISLGISPLSPAVLWLCLTCFPLFPAQLCP